MSSRAHIFTTLIVTVTIGAAAGCGSSSSSAGSTKLTTAPTASTSTTTSSVGPTTSATPASDAPLSTPPGMGGTYTDGGGVPISVERALTCPDGTDVWVTGTEYTTPAGVRYLCDPAAATTLATCATTGLQLAGDDAAVNGAFTGTVVD